MGEIEVVDRERRIEEIKKRNGRSIGLIKERGKDD
jgi:hypothetical protein